MVVFVNTTMHCVDPYKQTELTFMSSKHNLLYGVNFLSVAQKPNMDLGYLTVEVSRSHRIRHKHAQ